MLLAAVKAQIISEELRIKLPNHIKILNNWAILRSSKFGKDIYNQSPAFDDYLKKHLQTEEFNTMKECIYENLDNKIDACSFSSRMMNGWIYVNVNIPGRSIKVSKYINNWSRGNITYSKFKSIKNISEQFIILAILQYSYMFYEVYEYIPMYISHEIFKEYDFNIQGISTPLLIFANSLDYCSFIDTDHIFDSLGSIFNVTLYFKPGNKWVIRPPNIPILIKYLSNKIIVDMDTASFNNIDVSVIYIIPSSEDIKSEYIKKAIHLKKDKHLVEIDGATHKATSDYTAYVLDNYRVNVDYSGLDRVLLTI